MQCASTPAPHCQSAGPYSYRASRTVLPARGARFRSNAETPGGFSTVRAMDSAGLQSQPEPFETLGVPTLPSAAPRSSAVESNKPQYRLQLLLDQLTSEEQFRKVFNGSRSPF